MTDHVLYSLRNLLKDVIPRKEEYKWWQMKLNARPTAAMKL